MKVLRDLSAMYFIEPNEVLSMSVCHSGKIPEQNRSIWKIRIVLKNETTILYPSVALTYEAAAQIYYELTKELFPDVKEVIDYTVILGGD